MYTTHIYFFRKWRDDGDLVLAEHVWKDFEIPIEHGGFSFSFESEIIKVFPISQQEQVGDPLGLK